MARIVKEHDERLNEFLDTAQALFFSKGYDQTSIQDIVNAMNVAKGTFYYYFDSKVDVLDAVARRTRQRILAQVAPIVEDAALNPIDKLDRMFAEINSWKLANHDFVLDMLRMLYQDQNTLLRLKFFEETRSSIVEPFATIIQQGVAEKIFDVDYPYETADVILRIAEMPSKTLIAVLLAGQCNMQSVEIIKREVHVFNRSVERVLGTEAGVFNLIKADVLNSWLSVLETFPTSV